MKDTWNVYDWGKNLVNDRFRLISNLLLLFIILFWAFRMYMEILLEKVSYMHIRLVYWFCISYLSEYILVSAPFPV